MLRKAPTTSATSKNMWGTLIVPNGGAMCNVVAPKTIKFYSNSLYCAACNKYMGRRELADHVNDTIGRHYCNKCSKLFSGRGY